jgi:hypothetical protein
MVNWLAAERTAGQHWLRMEETAGPLDAHISLVFGQESSGNESHLLKLREHSQ